MYKIKRTSYKFDLFEPAIDFEAYDYYEPPEIRVDKHGRKVLVPKDETTKKKKVEKSLENLANEIVVGEFN
jgi:hypothetical protein